MPEISRFYGILIAIYYNDHVPPHFHAKYGTSRAKIDILTGQVLDGFLPRRALRLVEEWRVLHVDELNSRWTDAVLRRPLLRIAPLD